MSDGKYNISTAIPFDKMPDIENMLNLAQIGKPFIIGGEGAGFFLIVDKDRHDIEKISEAFHHVYQILMGKEEE